MKLLKKLDIDPANILDECTNGISDSGLEMRFRSARAHIVKNFGEYDHKAQIKELFSLPASARAKIKELVLAGITKEEFTDLYKYQLVGSSKPARKYYDKILMLAPLEKCPYCGFGQATTLDHFLPKARYPAFSVLSTNLIPSCTDCNKGKGASVITKNEQTLHPYFEDKIIESSPWLFAEVIETFPQTVRFFANPPSSWSIDLAQRTKNHFKHFNLASRFATEANSEIVSLSQLLSVLPSQQLREEHLSRISILERTHRTNTWKAALYEALQASKWFTSSGYTLFT